ncbi:MAG: hypothetical protein AAFN77_13510 [Planctomycetota bacterium]
MPEWNLESTTPLSPIASRRSGEGSNKRISRLLLIFAIASLSTGCNKLASTSLQESLVPPSQQAIAQALDQDAESTRNYIGQKVDVKQQPQARIVKAYDSASETGFKLTAKTKSESPAPSIASASDSIDAFMQAAKSSSAKNNNEFDGQPVARQATDPDCDHLAQCDCPQEVKPLKLPKMVMIDPTTIAKSTAKPTKATPVAPTIATVSLEQPISKSAADSNLAKTKQPAERLAYNSTHNSIDKTPILLGNSMGQQELPKTRDTVPLRSQSTGQVAATPRKTLKPLQPLLPSQATSRSMGAASDQATDQVVLKAKPTEVASKLVQLQARTPLQPPAKLQNSPSDIAKAATTEKTVDDKVDQANSLNNIRVSEIDPAMAVSQPNPTPPVDSNQVVDIEDDHSQVDSSAADGPRLNPEVKPLAVANDLRRNDSDKLPLMTVTPKIIVQPDEEDVETIVDVPSPVSDVSGSNSADSCECENGSCDRCKSEPSNDLEFPSESTTGNFSPMDCQCDDANCQCESATEVPAKQIGISSNEFWAGPENVSVPQVTPPESDDSNTFEAPAEVTSTNVAPSGTFQPQPRDSQFDLAVDVESVSQPVPTVPGAQLESPTEQPDPSNVFQLNSKQSELPSVDQLDQAIARTRGQTEYSPLPAAQEATEFSSTAVTLTEQIAALMAQVKSAIEVETDPAAKNGLEVNFQLLELLQQQTQQFDASGRMINNDQRRSLEHQLAALSAMLDSQQVRSETRNSETLDNLKDAVEELETLAELKVTNGVFCTKILGFGKFNPFMTARFASSQKMLIYCEVENQTTREVTNGIGNSEYRTQLQGSYVIYDAEGDIVQQEKFQPVLDTARNRRRDFYLYFPVQLRGLESGEYRLELMIEDIYGSKTATLDSGLHFSVN